MLINFVASKSNIESEIEYYRRIVEAFKKGGHTLISDWFEEAFEMWQKQSDFDELDWESIYAFQMESIAKADIVIADATVRSFAVGFQVAMALQQKKPTLVLQREESSNGAYYPSSAKDNLLKHRTYNSKNLEEIIDEFVKENTIDNKDLRFNFFIDRKIYNYLRWAAFKTGKTKAEILRDLVKNEIEKQDAQS
ncbi:MAG TPA: hypothetical protein VFI74_04625 [Candidatus Saccharimonadales bacterium]|nr:hypothetical protein [Candidatus Saccharimonadales bacterium]